MIVASGSYVGNATDDRTIVMNGVHDITAEFIIIKGSSFINEPQFWIQPFGVNNTRDPATGMYAGGIKQVLANSMVIGSDNRVNEAGQAFVWCALQGTAQGDMEFITWNGNGVDDRIIVTPTVPSMLMTFSDTQATVWGSIVHPPEIADPDNIRSQTLAGVVLVNKIQDFTECGIELGTHSQVNSSSGELYYGVVFRELTNVFKLVQYTGTGVAQAVPVGFQAEAVFVQIAEPSFSFTHPMMMRVIDATSVDTWRLDGFGGGLSGVGGITNIGATDFTVGTHPWVNSVGGYHVGFAIRTGESNEEGELTNPCAEEEPETPEVVCISPEGVRIPRCFELPRASHPVLVCR